MQRVHVERYILEGLKVSYESYSACLSSRSWYYALAGYSIALWTDFAVWSYVLFCVCDYFLIVHVIPLSFILCFVSYSVPCVFNYTTNVRPGATWLSRNACSTAQNDCTGYFFKVYWKKRVKEEIYEQIF